MSEPVPNPTPPNSQPDPAAVAASAQAASAVASPTTPTKVEKPAWVFDDAVFDPETGVKVDELGARAKALFDKNAEYETLAAARKADTPATFAEYGIEFPEGWKPPEGVEIDDKSSLWKTLQESAHKRGVTKAEYRETAAAFVEAVGAERLRAVETYKAQQGELLKQLGDNGAARVEAVNKTWKALFPEGTVADQLAQANFTPDIVKAFEKVQTALTSQGVVSFTPQGREAQGRADGKPENWDDMSPIDKRTWQLGQQTKPPATRR